MVDGNLVVMYNNVMPYSATASGTGPFSFEVILTPAGGITLQYLTMTGLLEQPHRRHPGRDRHGGPEHRLQRAYLHDNLAVQIRGALNWLSCDPVSGTVPPGGSVDVAVNFDATGVAVGPHDGLLQVLSDDPLTPVVQVPVTMMVSDLSPVVRPAAAAGDGAGPERAQPVQSPDHDRLRPAQGGAGSS